MGQASEREFTAFVHERGHVLLRVLGCRAGTVASQASRALAKLRALVPEFDDVAGRDGVAGRDDAASRDHAASRPHQAPDLAATAIARGRRIRLRRRAGGTLAALAAVAALAAPFVWLRLGAGRRGDGNSGLDGDAVVDGNSVAVGGAGGRRPGGRGELSRVLSTAAQAPLPVPGGRACALSSPGSAPSPPCCAVAEARDRR